jgi:quinol monooxygenase YgiN
MYVVTVLFRVRPEAAALFRERVCGNAATSLAQEPGCRQFDVCIDPAAPEVFFLYELYDSRVAFEAHLASPHFNEFNVYCTGCVEHKQVLCYARLPQR